MQRRKPSFDTGIIASVERIRTLLNTDLTFYDPDAPKIAEDEFFNEDDWTQKDLTTPDLSNVENYLRQQNDFQQNEIKAADAVKEIRREAKNERLKEIAKYDVDGSLMSLFRIWSLIPPVYKLSVDELAMMLARRVIYNQNDIIAINKPYNLSSRISLTEGGRLSVEHVVDKLRELIAPNSEKLYVVHRLDKCTTGILLLASSQLRATELRDMFKEKKIQKKYWALVKGVPDPNEGIIDIPLTEAKVGGRFKTIPVINPRDRLIKFGRSEMNDDDGLLVKNTPVTEYKVLKQGPKCALVECTTRSGFTHQVRCHLGFGIGTPIMGDHKYSDYLKFLPQRLAPTVLHLLGIRSAKSRAMPMHLHAKEIMIPEYSNGQNLQIRCLLPKYYVYVLRKLKISLK